MEQTRRMWVNRHDGTGEHLEDVTVSGPNWVSLDTLAAYSGQRAVHSRIAELRKRGYVIDHNGRAGAASAYRLVSLRDLH
jgi:hypothetical protein